MGKLTVDVAPKAAADLRPGDQVTTVRTVTQVVLTAAHVEVTFDDSTTQTFDLAGDPAIEVVVKQ